MRTTTQHTYETVNIDGILSQWNCLAAWTDDGKHLYETLQHNETGEVRYRIDGYWTIKTKHHPEL